MKWIRNCANECHSLTLYASLFVVRSRSRSFIACFVWCWAFVCWRAILWILALYMMNFRIWPRQQLNIPNHKNKRKLTNCAYICSHFIAIIQIKKKTREKEKKCSHFSSRFSHFAHFINVVRKRERLKFQRRSAKIICEVSNGRRTRYQMINANAFCISIFRNRKFKWLKQIRRTMTCMSTPDLMSLHPM